MIGKSRSELCCQVFIVYFSAMIASKKAEGLAAGLAAEDLGGDAEGGWGDDDLKLDDEEERKATTGGREKKYICSLHDRE